MNDVEANAAVERSASSSAMRAEGGKEEWIPMGIVEEVESEVVEEGEKKSAMTALLVFSYHRRSDRRIFQHRNKTPTQTPRPTPNSIRYGTMNGHDPMTSSENTKKVRAQPTRQTFPTKTATFLPTMCASSAIGMEPSAA
jgi:hypothetical protein